MASIVTTPTAIETRIRKLTQRDPVGNRNIINKLKRTLNRINNS